MHHRFDIDGDPRDLWLSRLPSGYHLKIVDGWEGPVALADGGVGCGLLSVNGVTEAVAYAVDGDAVHIHYRGRAYTVRYLDPLLALSSAVDAAGHAVARAPMPGTVVSVKVAPGDAVAAGTVLVVIESMKLETQIRASLDGVVEEVHVREGQSFDRGAALATVALGSS